MKKRAKINKTKFFLILYNIY